MGRIGWIAFHLWALLAALVVAAPAASAQLASDIIREVPGIVSVTYNIATKPPSTIEAV